MPWIYDEAWASFNLDWISEQGFLEKLAGGPLMNDWYAKLVRPPLTPPNWIFGPVWSVLYVMIAISLILYIKQTRQNPAWAYGVIIFHLITNFAWTGIFFSLQRPGWALVDIVLLDITLAVLIVHFWQSARPCSILLWPYFAWVLFATYLNAGFYLLNRV